MLRHLSLVILFLTLATASVTASAGGALPSGALTEIRISGASPGNERLIAVSLEARRGTPVADIDLEAERSRVLELGLFAAVTVSAEDRGSGPILLVEVAENPGISEIRISGSSLPEGELLRFIEQQDLLAAGSLLNTFRAQQARRTIQTAYRQAGLPFDVPVSLSLTPVDAATVGEAESVVVTYEVTENVPLSRVVIEDSEILDAATLEAAFEGLLRARQFSIAGYQQALEAVNQAYTERGFRGSGVSPERSALEGGTFNVRLRELRIGLIDTTEVGLDAAGLSLQPGDLFNYDVLAEDVRRLVAGATRDVRIETQLSGQGEVRVVFRQGPPETAGPVERIAIEGNTVIADEEIVALLSLQPGETFTSFLADEDFGKIVRLYGERGYLIVRQPDYDYRAGLYSQRLREVRVRGYELVYVEGEETRTEPEVITRYLPEPGGVYNAGALRDGLRRFAQLGVATPLEAPAVPTEAADEVTVQVVLREESARMFRPELSYDTDVGLSASISYDDRNLFGQAHSVSAELNGQSTALGLQLGGSLSYNVPWLYADILDFKEVPTSVSGALFSQVFTGQPLTAQGGLRLPLPGTPGGPDNPDNQVLIGDYLQRDTGLSFGVGRQIFANTTLSASVRGVSTSYSLEPGRPCEVVGGNVVDRNCTLSGTFPGQAADFLPQSGLSGFVTAGTVYDDRDNPEFPTRGVNASGRLGLGFGTDYRDPATNLQTPYNYQQLEFGVRSYLTLAELGAAEGDHQVLAFRANVGHQLGGNYPANRLFIVGQTQVADTQIRGYTRDDILPSRSYLTSSIEYRYNFGLETFATQTIIGIVFADLGYASSVAPELGNLLVGAGLGVQINFGFGNVLLPPLRFDYGLSPRNPLGVFGFRIGPVF
ncbi:MAG: BamA/TamA family outer membrane protein [Deinococcota bacterium]|nr:BamA/TamA family outer membrane protein [Deinococcota bacterium]